MSFLMTISSAWQSIALLPVLGKTQTCDYQDVAIQRGGNTFHGNTKTNFILKGLDLTVALQTAEASY